MYLPFQLYAQTLAMNVVFLPLHSGHFITVEEQVQEDQGKAVLLGPDVEQQDWSCFRMVYQVTGSASLQVQKRTDGESFDQVLWTTQGPSDSWLIASIDLQNSTETFKVRTIYAVCVILSCYHVTEMTSLLYICRSSLKAN